MLSASISITAPVEEQKADSVLASELLRNGQLEMQEMTICYTSRLIGHRLIRIKLPVHKAPCKSSLQSCFSSSCFTAEHSTSFF